MYCNSSSSEASVCCVSFFFDIAHRKERKSSLRCFRRFNQKAVVRLITPSFHLTLSHENRHTHTADDSEFCCFHFLGQRNSFSCLPRLRNAIKKKEVEGRRKKSSARLKREQKHQSHEICASLTNCDMEHKFVKFLND